MWEEANWNWWDSIGPLLFMIMCLALGGWIGYHHGYDKGYEKGKEDILETQRKEAIQARQRRKVLRLLQRHKAELREGKTVLPSDIDANSVLEVIEAAEKAVTTRAGGPYYYYPPLVLQEYASYCRANDLPIKWVQECENYLALVDKMEEEA